MCAAVSLGDTVMPESGEVEAVVTCRDEPVVCATEKQDPKAFCAEEVKKAKQQLSWHANRAR